MTLFDEEPICAPQGSTDADSFQTPPYALAPLYPYLQAGSGIWEPCCGEGNIVRTLCAKGYNVIGSDILTGRDFLTTPVPAAVSFIVTNPPYSIMDKILERAYALGLPFAFLLPITAIGGKARQQMYRKYGMEIIMLGRRINFKTPTGKTDKNGSAAPFETAWFTHGLGIGKPLTFTEIREVNE